MADTRNIECIDDFKRWKVPQLKEYIQHRGFPTSGKRKEELVALAYAAWAGNLPVVLTKSEQQSAAKREYDRLLLVDGVKLPDPLSDLQEGWVGEGDGVCLWPPCMYINIQEYLVEKDARTILTQRLKNDYKEGKAYSYFASQESWVREVSYHPISSVSTVCFLRTEVTPSQNVSKVPHNVWICLDKQTGDIRCAYCSCFAGLGSTCNHVAALLFKVDYAWQHGLSNIHKKPCTSKENTWLAPTLKKIEPMEANDMVVQKPHYLPKKRSVQKSHVARQLFTVNRSKTSQKLCLDTITAAVYPECTSAVVWQYSLADAIPDYNPCDDINVAAHEVCSASAPVPEPLTSLARKFTGGDKLWRCLPSYTFAEVRSIEEATRDQNASGVWKSQRVGRITASFAHRVMTKYRSSDNPQDVSTLLKLVMGKDAVSDHIPALKYGRQNEPVAADYYYQKQKRHHANLKVSTCGLHVKPDSIYVGASPDRLVTCVCCGDGLLEIKCPISLAGKDPSKEHVSYLKLVDGKCQLNRNHPYYSQVQFQMGITRKPWCDFMVFTHTNSFIERIFFDDSHWQILFLASTKFFRDHISKALVDQRFEHEP